MTNLQRWLVIAATAVALAIVAAVAFTLNDQGSRPSDGGRPGSPGVTTTTIPLNPVQKAINAKCRKGGVVELSGTYMLAETVSIEKCRDLTVRGPVTLDGSAPGRAREARHFSIRNSRDIVIEDVTVLGGRCVRPCENSSGGLAANERQHGFEVAASDRVELRRVHAVNVWGDGVYVTAKTFEAQVTQTPTEIRVVDSYIENTGRQGIAVAGVAGMVVQGTTIRLANRSVLDFEAESGGASNFEFRDSHIVEPDNASLNVSCKGAANGGQMLNQGPFTLIGNRVYGDQLKVNPFNCDLPPGMVIERDNVDQLPVSEAPVRPVRENGDPIALDGGQDRAGKGPDALTQDEPKARE